MTITHTTTVTFKMPEEYIALQQFRQENNTAGWIRSEAHGCVCFTKKMEVLSVKGED